MVRRATQTTRRFGPAAACLWALVAATWLAGCSPEYYRERADREVYEIISEKATEVPGMDPDFRLPADWGEPPFVPVSDEDTVTLSLADAVSAAAGQSQTFQSAREDVYLEALDLTYQRYLWGPRFTGTLSAMWERSEGESSLGSNVGLGVTKALATGADVSLRLSSAFLMFLSGDPRKSARSALEVSLTQPLWRGAGARVAQENLTQAEREMVYQLRTFVRFRREFFVSVASYYYRVLQQQDGVENEAVNLRNLTAARERAEMLASAGRLPEFQVDQTRQDELRARDRWLRAVQTYESMLDEFKITLGFPTEAQLVLDPGELSRLRSVSLEGADYGGAEAVKRALTHRLDLASTLDRFADARRRVHVAEDNLGPDVDLVARAALGTAGDKTPLNFTTRGGLYGAGLEVDLPLDRLQERNAYRQSLIALSRASRAYGLLRDRVAQQIHAARRNLAEAMESYKIQQTSVELAERRVEIASLMMESGRAEARVLLESQDDLLQARNTLTRALVDHRIATLELYRDMGSLTFENGQFTEAVPNDELTTDF